MLTIDHLVEQTFLVLHQEIYQRHLVQSANRLDQVKRWPDLPVLCLAVERLRYVRPRCYIALREAVKGSQRPGILHVITLLSFHCFGRLVQDKSTQF